MMLNVERQSAQMSKISLQMTGLTRSGRGCFIALKGSLGLYILLCQCQYAGWRAQLEIRRVVLTVLSSFLRQSCLVFT